VTALLVMAAQCNAQEIRLGPQAGYQKARDADTGKLMVGAALRLKLSSSLGIEGSINYRHEKFADNTLTVRSWPVMATALIYPIPFIYGAAGAGWYNTTFDYDEKNLASVDIKDETTQEIGWHFGGGLELPIGSNSKLAADIRYVFIDYEFQALPGTKDLDSDFYVATVGLLWGL
jgi:opacity protein-like surface antigen